MGYFTYLYVALILFTACASGGEWRWTKLGTTETESRRDAYDCYRDAMMIPASPHLPAWRDTYDRQELYDSCMKSKGYQRVRIR